MYLEDYVLWVDLYLGVFLNAMILNLQLYHSSSSFSDLIPYFLLY